MKMDTSKLTPAQRQTRSNVRNFLLTANRAQLEAEINISEERGDEFRRACVQELLDEYEEPTRPNL